MLDRARKYLSIIFQIFVRDLKRLVVNPVACIILAGVCILPALYAWYTIETMWDPYANTGSIKVAVVNEDKGADSSYTGKINIGQEVVDELQSNHALDWQFVSKDEAMDGVYSSEYYAALIFPENFSEDFISVFSGNFTQPKIEYYVNEKLSGSGTKVTDSAASKIETTIDESFVSQVSDKVVEIAQRTGDAVHDKGEQSTSLLSYSVEEAKNAISQNRTMVNDLTPTIESSIRSVDSSNDLLKKLIASLPALDARLDSASTSLENIRKTLNDYSATLSAKVTESALALTQAAVDINLASAQIAGDIQTAKTNVDTALARACQLQQPIARIATKLPCCFHRSSAESHQRHRSTERKPLFYHHLARAARKPARQQCANGQKCHRHRGQRSKNKRGQPSEEREGFPNHHLARDRHEPR